MQHKIVTVFFVAVALLASHSLHAMRVSGQIELRGSKSDDASLADAVVYFVPNTPITEAATPATHTPVPPQQFRPGVVRRRRGKANSD